MSKFKILSRRIAAALAGVAMVCASVLSGATASAVTMFNLSPMNQVIVLNPGDTYRNTFMVTNPSYNDDDLYYKIEIQPYYTDEDDHNVFSEYTERNLITGWVTIVGAKNGVLSPNETRNVEYRVDVPSDAPAGGQYVAITVVTDNEGAAEDDSMGIQENIAIAYLLYAEIAGSTYRQGEIQNANVSSFVFDGNITGSSAIKNTGNTHGTAKYTLQVFPLFSDEEVFTNEEEPETRVILPDRTLYNELAWTETPAIGVFNVVYTVEFEGVTQQVSKMVIKCPLWLLFAVVFVIAAIIIYIVMRTKSRKK